jgi:hypothetical protein
VAGSDPCCPDGWDFGNVYSLQPPGAMVKHRNLPNVVHTWGLWGENGVLYASTGSHTGDNQTPVAQIFRSLDQAQSWTHLVDIGQFRAYDIAGFNGALYSIYNNELYDHLSWAESLDGGFTWSDIPGENDIYPIRMFPFNNFLLAVNYSRNEIHALDSSGAVTVFQVPFNMAQQNMFNVMASTGDGYLYTFSENGSLYRTTDLSTWEFLYSTGRQLTSIAWWPANNWLILGDRGANAKLWKVNLNVGVSLQLKAYWQRDDLLLSWISYPAYRSYTVLVTSSLTEPFEVLYSRATSPVLHKHSLTDGRTYYYLVQPEN